MKDSKYTNNDCNKIRTSINNEVNSSVETKNHSL